MATEIIVPKVDMVMETATFMQWLKKEGETVQKGDPLFVIETDKAAIEIEAPASGELGGLRAKADEIIPVTTVIGYILKENETLPDLAQTKGPQAASQTEQISESLSPLIPALVAASPKGVRATPLARKMARELGIELKKIQGRGPLGRIYRMDVLQALEAKPAAAIPLATSEFQIQLPKARERGRLTLKGARAIIAHRMSFSAATIPHIYETVTVNMDEVHRLREMLAESVQASSGSRLTYTAILTYAAAQVLRRHPNVNCSLDGDEIVQWEDVNIGLATDMEDYLIVPVVKQAQLKSLAEIAQEIGRLVDAARARKLTPADMQDGTFTISNLGMYGIETFTALINPPEAAILAVGKIQEKRAFKNGREITHHRVKLTVGADHRVVDGAKIARFIIDLKAVLENPYRLL